MKRTLLLAVGLLIVSGAAPLLAAAVGRPLTLPVQTPAWMVVTLAGAFVLLTIALAKLLDLPALARRLAAPRRPLEAVFADLADLAQLARDGGLLPAAADPRAAAHPMLISGLHLLIRDPDERLVRSAIEAEEDRLTHQSGDARALTAAACRAGLPAALIAGAGAALLLASRLEAPWTIAASSAAGAFGLILGSVVWLCVGGRVADALLRRNAEGEVLAHAAKVVVLAVHGRLDRDATLARLARLLPEAAEGGTAADRSRKAA